MSNKQAPLCPGCGKEMRIMRHSYYGGVVCMWYVCDCGWWSPIAVDEGVAYDKAVKRSGDSRWISVKDEMPEQRGYYLVACVREDVPRVLYFDGKTWAVSQSHYHVPEYWMELPALPGEEELTMDFADKLDLMDDDCDIEGFQTERRGRRKIRVVLTAFVQTSYEDYTHMFRTVEIDAPDDGNDWHVCGEEWKDER